MNVLELIQTFGPYVGGITVLSVAAVVAAYLARHGLVLKRFKFKDAEVEFNEASGGAKAREEQENPSQPKLSAKVIEFSSMAREDCKSIDISSAEITDFINRESESHFRLFSSKFVSMPLLFGPYICVLSWSGETAFVERVLKRRDAYPLNDGWIAALSAYRMATMLPYRVGETTVLVSRTEAVRTHRVFRSLLHNVRNYLRSLSIVENTPSPSGADLDHLLDEAEFALHNDDIASAVTRFEAMLSGIHKLLLRYVPSGVSVIDRRLETKPYERLGAGVDKGEKGEVLVVEDDQIQAEYLKSFLEEHEFSVVVAATSIAAMRVLTDRTFDVVIVDVLLGAHDGFEIVRAARASSPDSTIIVLTAFAGMAGRVIGDESRTPIWDFFVEKSAGLAEIEAILSKRRQAKTPNPTAPADRKAPLSGR